MRCHVNVRQGGGWRETKAASPHVDVVVHAPIIGRQSELNTAYAHRTYFLLLYDTELYCMGEEVLAMMEGVAVVVDDDERERRSV